MDSLPDSSPIGMYFRQKVRDISPSFFEERDFRREPQSTEHYLEIPNASFRSPEIRIDTSLYPREFYRDFVDTY